LNTDNSHQNQRILTAVSGLMWAFPSTLTTWMGVQWSHPTSKTNENASHANNGHSLGNNKPRALGKPTPENG
jgi:hypothetical protein